MNQLISWKWTSQTPDLCKIKIFCLSHPVYSVLWCSPGRLRAGVCRWEFHSPHGAAQSAPAPRNLPTFLPGRISLFFAQLSVCTLTLTLSPSLPWNTDSYVLICSHLIFPCSSRFSCVWLFVTPWTAAWQAPLTTGFSRQQHWSGLPFPSPGDLSDSGIEPVPPAAPTLHHSVHFTPWAHPNWGRKY